METDKDKFRFNLQWSRKIVFLFHSSVINEYVSDEIALLY